MDWAWSNNPTLAKKDAAPDCLAYKKTLSAQDFMQYMIGVLHVQFVKMEPVPWLEQRKRETAAQNRPGSQSSVDIAIATVNYKVNKITIEEQIQVNVYCHSNSLGANGQYQNSCNGGVLRRWAPQGQLAANQDTFKAILSSFNIDQEWQSRYDADDGAGDQRPRREKRGHAPGSNGHREPSDGGAVQSVQSIAADAPETA